MLKRLNNNTQLNVDFWSASLLALSELLQPRPAVDAFVCQEVNMSKEKSEKKPVDRDKKRLADAVERLVKLLELKLKNDGII